MRRVETKLENKTLVGFSDFSKTNHKHTRVCVFNEIPIRQELGCLCAPINHQATLNLRPRRIQLATASREPGAVAPTCIPAIALITTNTNIDITALCILSELSFIYIHYDLNNRFPFLLINIRTS